jgi:hypothetical protein
MYSMVCSLRVSLFFLISFLKMEVNMQVFLAFYGSAGRNEVSNTAENSTLDRAAM